MKIQSKFVILVFVCLILAGSMAGSAAAAPIFTGSVPHDFTAPDVLVVHDPGNIDVGVTSLFPAGTISGWDMAAIYLDYDSNTDTMYVGIDCYVICGDADGDGNPGNTSAILRDDLFGHDFPDLFSTESFVVLFDTNNDYTGPFDPGNFDAAVGVNATMDLSGFAAYEFTGNAFNPAGPFGPLLPNTVTLFGSPDVNAPDFEFSIADFSTLPGFTFTPGDDLTFQLSAYAGSREDPGIGEDYLPGFAGFTTITFSSTAAIGDYVWEDANTNGIQDGGETGIAGVNVNLYDGTGGLVGSASTDTNGYYGFDRLTPGDYFVEFVLPTGYQFTPQDQGTDDSVDSDANTSDGRTNVTNLIAGENDTSWDAGLYRPASIGDYIWEDSNLNGIQEFGEFGIAGVSVLLRDGTGGLVASTVTDGNGFYLFTNLMPGYYNIEVVPPTSNYRFTLPDQGSDDLSDSDVDPNTGETAVTQLVSGENDASWDGGMYQVGTIGDTVWYDILDANGVQDVGEPGVPGATVNLFDSGGNLIASAVTDLAGQYLFTDLPPGAYSVTVDAASLPAGLLPTYDYDGVLTPHTAQVNLSLGETNLNLDFGYMVGGVCSELGSIGDTVWDDVNGDGVQDAGEPGLAGVEVTAEADTDGDGVIDFTVTTHTDADGLYLFDNLPAGEYIVSVNPDTLPDGMTQTYDLDGIGTPHSATVTLAAGEDNDQVDFGYTDDQGANVCFTVTFVGATYDDGHNGNSNDNSNDNGNDNGNENDSGHGGGHGHDGNSNDNS
ncbi:MAG: SdrD B-like domain-containing protein, partial [Anaerolineae bacterium]